MTKLTFSKTMRIFTMISGLALSGGFGFAFFYYLHGDPTSIVSWAVFFSLFLAFLILSILGVLEAIFSYCTFDDENGIEYYCGFSKIKKIPISSLESFRLNDRGISISYKVFINSIEKTKTLTLSRYYKDLPLLHEWLDSHTTNLYIEEWEKSIEDFRKSHEEISDEEKVQVFERVNRVAKILKWLGALIALFFIGSVTWLDKTFQLIAFALCAAYPIVLLLIMHFSNGEIRCNVKDGEINPSILSPFLFCSGALSIIAYVYFDLVYDLKKQFLVAFLTTLTIFLLYYLCASEAEKMKDAKPSMRILNLCSLFFLMFIYGIGFSLLANVLLDKSEPTPYQATIIDKRISGGKYPSYNLKVTPWIDEKRANKEISVGKKLYMQTEANDIVLLKLHKGFLGVPWVRVTLQNKI